jgi:hypothetical protein
MSIFACDRHAVYSNTTSEELRDLEPRIVKYDLTCQLRGRCPGEQTTWIFRELWHQVWLDGQFRFAAWTVKVEPDAVFFPHRLRDIVGDNWHAGAQEGNGMFLSNCELQDNLHGAVEVLSRRALEVYVARNWPNCKRILQEDYYLHECLVHLGVKEFKDFKLLGEENCTSEWRDCTSARVAFHPFETLQSYGSCVSNAQLSGSWSPTPQQALARAAV